MRPANSAGWGAGQGALLVQLERALHGRDEQQRAQRRLLALERLARLSALHLRHARACHAEQSAPAQPKGAQQCAESCSSWFRANQAIPHR